ncbi:hypothetical protein F4780DRAFT_308097 [Xylariomycetidae sp. FL0641]|nr:hypothetical protein F4780DRAFT_308097 [Xylariomycetidae sp. FL0641]
MLDETPSSSKRPDLAMLSSKSLRSQSYRLLYLRVEEIPSSHDASPRRTSVLTELAELAPAVACSIINTSYISERQSASSPPTFPYVHSSPILVVGACVVLGCCVSSYTYRRRQQDQYQTTVFVVAIAWALCVGLAVGCSADMILLAMVPWAINMAIFSSFLGHAAVRWLSMRPKCDRETVLGDDKRASAG